MEVRPFIKVRILQLLNELKNSGPIYALIILAVIVALLIFFGLSIRSTQSVLISCGILILAVTMIHFNRSDHQFLMVNIDNPKLIVFFEYAFFSFPFVLLACIGNKSLLPAATFPVLYLISLIQINKKSKNKKISNTYFIPAHNYEWLSGIRKSGIVYLFLLFSSLVLAFIPFATMVLLWFSLIVVSSFYEIHETQDMLESFERPASGFLLNKIFNHVVLIFVPQALVLTVATFIHPERWWIHLFFLIYASLMIAVFIVSKYSVWSNPGAHRSVNITNAICLTGFFIPFLLPLPIILLFVNYRKSLKRLRPLLHDYSR